MTDYAAIARKYGGQPAEGTAPDYAALAKQYGGAPVSDAPAEPRSMFGEIARQVGLTARAGVKGVSSLGTLAGDILNLGSSAALNRFLTRIGLPEPENETEQFAQRIATSMAGAGAGVGLGGLMANSAAPVAKGVGEVLKAGPGMQTISAATGTAAGAAAKESGAGTWGQMGAALLGGAAPSLGTMGVQEMARRIARGGEAGRLRTEANIQAFDAADAQPSVGQATGGGVAQYIEGLSGKVPGGAGVLSGKAKQTAEDFGRAIAGKADDLAIGANPEKAGRTIEKGIRGFVERFKTQQGQLYDELDRFIDPQRRVEVANTRQALADLTADIPGAPNLSEFFKNAKIGSIRGALEKDVAQGAQQSQAALLVTAAQAESLPYEAIKKLRTLVGEQLEGVSLAGDIPRSKWKALYGALSQDMENAAKGAGKDATKAFSRANAFTKAGHDRIEGFLDRVSGRPAPEDAFKAITSGLDDGATSLAATMRSLKPGERRTVTAAFLKRMGTATPGKQNETGDVFSIETFLTNWNKLSPPAKAQLFGNHTGTMQKDLEQIAKAASAVRDGSKVLANPSGSGVLGMQGAIWGSAAGLAGTGNAGAAAAVLSAIPASYGAAKLMTNPRFVRWLAKSTELSPAAVPAQLHALSAIARRESPEDRQAIDEYISQIQQ